MSSYCGYTVHIQNKRFYLLTMDLFYSLGRAVSVFISMKPVTIERVPRKFELAGQVEFITQYYLV